MESRLAEIEAKLSFSDELLEALNRTVYRQQQQIDQLQRELRALREQVQSASPGEPRNLRDETPPHY
jgi:SlyX protein